MANQPKLPQIKGLIPPKKGKIIALHYHPLTIKGLIHELKESMKEDEKSYNLLTDVEVLVHWALARLPLVPPKKPASESSDTGNKTD